MRIKLLQIKEATSEQVLSPQKVADIMRAESKADRECLWVLHLNTDKRIIEKELVAMGVLNSACVHPREIFKKAIINSSYSIIIVHNHPSGNIKPSSDDRKIYKQLSEAGHLLQIEVDDFIIISYNGEFWSASTEHKGGN